MSAPRQLGKMLSRCVCQRWCGTLRALRSLKETFSASATVRPAHLPELGIEVSFWDNKRVVLMLSTRASCPSWCQKAVCQGRADTHVPSQELSEGQGEGHAAIYSACTVWCAALPGFYLGGNCDGWRRGWSCDREHIVAGDPRDVHLTRPCIPACATSDSPVSYLAPRLANEACSLAVCLKPEAQPPSEACLLEQNARTLLQHLPLYDTVT